MVVSSEPEAKASGSPIQTLDCAPSDLASVLFTSEDLALSNFRSQQCTESLAARAEQEEKFKGAFSALLQAHKTELQEQDTDSEYLPDDDLQSISSSSTLSFRGELSALSENFQPEGADHFGGPRWIGIWLFLLHNLGKGALSGFS